MCIAFSNRKVEFVRKTALEQGQSLFAYSLDPLYVATIDATEEAVVNALVAAETMEGNGGSKIYALPVGGVKAMLSAGR